MLLVSVPASIRLALSFGSQSCGAYSMQSKLLLIVIAGGTNIIGNGYVGDLSSRQK